MELTHQKILVMGGTGMLGHKLVQALGDRCEVTATFRECDGPWRRLPLFTETVQAVGGVDAADFEAVRQVVERTRPEVVVNCIGVVKQLDAASDTVTTMQINALFPHRLADICGAVGSRLIHISTDCVFSGRVGDYDESDMPDAEDLYGRSKQLGEVIRPGCLSIRTSIIGREITKAVGLLEWLFGRRGRVVDGFTRAVFSGLTTLEFSRILAQVVSDHGDLAGLYHVASEPITKFDLLSRINHALDLGIDIEAVDEPTINRSLDGSRFVEATGIRVPSWDKMISDLATDRTPYEEWRRFYGST